MSDCMTWYPEPELWADGSMKESSRARRYGEATATIRRQADQRGEHLHDRPETHTGNEQERQRDEAEDHGRAHVRLGQDEHAGEAGDDEQRADDAAIGGVLIEAASDEVCGEQSEGELHQLGRLQAELPEAHPAARPHGVDAEARDQHHEEEAERHEEDQRAEAAQLSVVEANGHIQGDGADRHPHGLPDEDGVGRAVGGDGDDRRRRADHHEPDEAEQHHVERSSVETETRRLPMRMPSPSARAAAPRCAADRGAEAPFLAGVVRRGRGAVCRSVGALLRVDVMPPTPPGRGRATQPGPTPDACG